MPEPLDAHPRRRTWGRRLPAVWTDATARFLRTNALLGSGHRWLTTRLVPFVLAVVVVAPVGILILPFFIPKFLRTAQRRRRFGVRMVRAGERPLVRIERTTPRPPTGGSAVRPG